MRTGLALAAASLVVLTAGVLLAAGGQGQERPGLVGQARVFVENHLGRNEAVPIVLEAVAPQAVIQTKLTRQAWEYRSVRTAPAQDPAAALAAAGADGWEAVTAQPSEAGGLLIVLKRPR